MNKILSVVVPTYNVKNYLDRCLLSLTADEHTLRDLDIIIVNDGSLDSSLEIAKRYEKKYSESITVIDKENGGHGSTINTGLKYAIGKYFRVLDSDDWVNTLDFKPFIKDLKKQEADAVLTNYTRELVYEGVAQHVEYKHLKYNKKYDLNTIDLNLFGDEYMYMHTLTIKTDILRAVNLSLDENTFYVDMEYITLPLTKLDTFIYLDYDIYHYWIGRPDQSMNIVSMFKNRSHHERVLKRLAKLHTDKAHLNENKRAYLFNILVLMLNTHYEIYMSRKLNSSELKEIRQFDKWLQNYNLSLYKAAAIKFPHIEPYRQTGFIFSSFLNKKFNRLSHIITSKKIHIMEENK